MITPDNWFIRGVQSAVFYYLSCGPCLNVHYSRRRNKEAARDRKKKELQLARMPELYAHPGPAEMNKHWREDMELGPEMPRKKPRRNTKESASKQGWTQKTSLELAEEKIDYSFRTEKPGGIGVKRYQRADEEVEWTGQERVDTKARTGADYRMLKAPPLNDLHPAVVSILPLKPEDRRWMKEPPPSTDFLHGLKGVTTIDRSSSSRRTQACAVDNDQDLLFPQRRVSLRNSPNILEPAPVLTKKSRRRDKDRRNVPVSRPDSAVSTSGRVKSRSASRVHHESSTASSDADDDSERDRGVIARPRAVHRIDAQPSRQNSARSRHGIAGRDFANPSAKTSTSTPPQTTPLLLSHCTNSENLSPRVSPGSLDTLASPISSDDDALSPRIRSIKVQTTNTEAVKVALPASVVSSHPQRHASKPDGGPTLIQPFSIAVKPDALSDDAASITDAATTTTEHLSGMLAGLGLHEHPATPDLSSIDYKKLLQLQDMSENAAKEQMWLGPRPAKSSVGTPEKRHSVDF